MLWVIKDTLSGRIRADHHEDKSTDVQGADGARDHLSRHIDQLRLTAVGPHTVEVSPSEVVGLPLVLFQQSAPPNVVGTIPEVFVADQPEMDSVPSTYSYRSSGNDPCESVLWFVGGSTPGECVLGTTETLSLNCCLFEKVEYKTLFVGFVCYIL